MIRHEIRSRKQDRKPSIYIFHLSKPKILSCTSGKLYFNTVNYLHILVMKVESGSVLVRTSLAEIENVIFMSWVWMGLACVKLELKFGWYVKSFGTSTEDLCGLLSRFPRLVF